MFRNFSLKNTYIAKFAYTRELSIVNYFAYSIILTRIHWARWSSKLGLLYFGDLCKQKVFKRNRTSDALYAYAHVFTVCTIYACIVFFARTRRARIYILWACWARVIWIAQASKAHFTLIVQQTRTSVIAKLSWTIFRWNFTAIKIKK